MRAARAAVTTGSVGAALLTCHTAVNARLLRRPPQHSASPSVLISVLVPARNEQGRIGSCVHSVLASQGVQLELLVLDDQSTDETAAEASAAIGGDPRGHVVPGTAPPARWLGKPHACMQLAAAARGDVLVFLDADVTLAPDGLARTVSLLLQAGLDLACPYPRQLTATSAERLVQPLLQWSWLTFLPLRLAERPAAPTLSAANGQLLACRTNAYRGAGGHAAVHAAVLEDLALARAFKRAGYTVAMVDGTEVAACRMYAGWGALRDGYTKSLWAAFGSPRGAVAGAGILSLLYLLPPAAAVFASGRTRRVGAAGYAAAVAGRVITAHTTGGPLRWAPAHPVSISILLRLLVRSFNHRSRGLLRWKDRPL